MKFGIVLPEPLIIRAIRETRDLSSRRRSYSENRILQLEDSWWSAHDRYKRTMKLMEKVHCMIFFLLTV